jgi:hypothetical protein
MRWPCYELALLFAAVAAMSPTFPQRSEAYYDCYPTANRSAQGNGIDLASSTFVDLPGSIVPIQSDVGSCIRIDFSAQIRAKHPKGVRVRALVVGTTVAGFPAAAQFYTSENSFDGRMTSFVIRNMGGNISVKLQVLSTDGTLVTIGRWTMAVQFVGGLG